jgi:hypothetical protein
MSRRNPNPKWDNVEKLINEHERICEDRNNIENQIRESVRAGKQCNPATLERLVKLTTRARKIGIQMIEAHIQ